MILDSDIWRKEWDLKRFEVVEALGDQWKNGDPDVKLYWKRDPKVEEMEELDEEEMIIDLNLNQEISIQDQLMEMLVYQS